MGRDKASEPRRPDKEIRGTASAFAPPPGSCSSDFLAVAPSVASVEGMCVLTVYEHTRVSLHARLSALRAHQGVDWASCEAGAQGKGGGG